MLSTRVTVCVIPWLLLLPFAQPEYTCEGYNDRQAEWPTDEELLNFAETLEGDVYLPGSEQYEKAGLMKSLVYSTKFGAIVYPENTDDVQKAVLFAKEHGIRPTVVSSGHDYNGRSVGVETLSINMTRINHINVNPGEKSMKVGPGTIWLDIYEEVDDHDLVAVGGSAHTVSPSGYTMGGGHSPVTRKLGLGVDSVLEFTMVTADGSIVTVNENDGSIVRSDGTTEALDDNGDLWWSVLGGGGGVYGIVTEFKYKLHDAPSDGFVRFHITYPIATADTKCIGIAEKALEKFFALLRDGLSNNWGGYIIITKPTPEDPNKDLYAGAISLFMNHWGGDMEQAKAELESLTDYRPDCQFDIGFVEFETFLEYERTANDPIYIRNFVVNTIIQEEDLDDDSGLAEFLTAINDFPLDYGQCTGTILGGAGNVPSHEAKSVSPDLRTGLISLSCGGGWGDPGLDDVYPHTINDWAVDHLYKYGTGAYYNEPDYFLENHKIEFWKTEARYNRLLQVKQRWDPDNLFWCHHCVGSDQVEYESAESCPTPFNTPFNASPASGKVRSATPIILSLLLVLIITITGN